MRPDIVAEMLALAAKMCPAITHADLLRIDAELRKKYGGSESVYIARTSAEWHARRDAAIAEARKTGAVSDAATRHGVSRATLYRLLAAPGKK